MRRLAKAFIDIALWRQTPAHLPASRLLLAIVAAAAALLEVFGALLPPTANGGEIGVRIVLAVIVPLCFAWAVLAVARRRPRFLQTGSALLGVGVLAGIVLYPLDSLYQLIGTDRIIAQPVGLLLYVGWIWYLLVCANIWRAALDCGLILGGAISLGYLILQIALEEQLISHT
jgi:hypothetical protein